MNHLKRLWGYYLTFILLVVLLSIPINGIYHIILDSLGKESALLSLTIAVMVVLILGVQGAIHAHGITQNLRSEIKNLNHQKDPAKIKVPLMFKILKIEEMPSSSQGPLPDSKKSLEESIPTPHPFTTYPGRRRGKQPRFPEDKIRKAVLKWEQRDPFFEVRTLEEFLAQEFGSSPDGILLMATTTFYDWRRRILRELEAREKP
jgi:hypothetical protein